MEVELPAHRGLSVHCSPEDDAAWAAQVERLEEAAPRGLSLHAGSPSPEGLRHLRRLSGLEEIARRFKGVKDVYAVRAGKEIRVIVSAEEVTDKESVWLSKDIARRIEKESDYPGQLRVTVIRETRSVGYAM